MTQEVRPVPSGKAVFTLEGGGAAALPVVETVLTAWRKADELRKADRDQYEYLEWFAAHVKEKAGAAVTIDEAEAILGMLEEDYRQKKMTRTPSNSPPSSPASTSSTPSA